MTEVAINELVASKPARPPRSTSALAAARSIGFLAIVFLGAFLGGIVESHREAKASRNSSGTYSTPNTFVTGTAISSTNVNANFSDIATEMTDSLDRSGKGGMLAALRGIDGTVAAPAFSWTSETGSGLFRNGTNDVRMSIGGTAKGFWSATGFGVGGAPTKLFHVINGSSGATPNAAASAVIESSGTQFLHLLAPNANHSGIILGDVASPGRGYIQYNNSADSNPDTMRFGVGSSDRVIISTGGLIVGSSGTAIATVNTGTCTLNGGSPSTCTATVASGAKCVANLVAAGAANGVSYSLSGTTATFTCSNGLVNVVDYFCF